jgi:hypothetical protein
MGSTSIVVGMELVVLVVVVVVVSVLVVLGMTTGIDGGCGVCDGVVVVWEEATASKVPPLGDGGYIVVVRTGGSK